MLPIEYRVTQPCTYLHAEDGVAYGREATNCRLQSTCACRPLGSPGDWKRRRLGRDTMAAFVARFPPYLRPPRSDGTRGAQRKELPFLVVGK